MSPRSYNLGEYNLITLITYILISVVYAMSAHNMNASLLCAFRTYPASAEVMPDCRIWKALRASTAHPKLFKSTEIEEIETRHRFMNGAFGCSNPTSQLLKEASMVFPDRFLSSVTSIGTGHASTIPLPQPSTLERVFPFGIFATSRAFRDIHGIVTENEKVADEIGVRFSNAGNVYYRMNVDQETQTIEAGGGEKRSGLVGDSRAYLRRPEVSPRLDSLVVAIQGRSARLRTVQMGMQIPSFI